MSYIDPSPNTGSYVPTTLIWDVQQMMEVDVKTPEFKELLVRLYQNVNLIAVALNTKDSAFYQREEFLTGAQWYNPSNADPNQYRVPFRKVVNFGALPAAGSKSVAHNSSFGVPTTFTTVRFAAEAINQTTGAFLHIPYVHATDPTKNIQLDGSATQVTITTGGFDYSSFSICNVIIEYLKI